MLYLPKNKWTMKNANSNEFFISLSTSETAALYLF